MDRGMNEEVRRRDGIERELESRAESIEMVWASRKNGWVPYGQNDVDGGSKWRAGTRETEVRLDGWCAGGLRQQRNNGGGCTSMRERSERVEGLGTYVTEWVSRGHFCLALCSFGQPSRALVVLTLRGVVCRYTMRLGQTVERAQLLNVKTQMSSIWAKGCMLMTVCVISDLTWVPLLGEKRKSWYIIIIIILLL